MQDTNLGAKAGVRVVGQGKLGYMRCRLHSVRYGQNGVHTEGALRCSS